MGEGRVLSAKPICRTICLRISSRSMLKLAKPLIYAMTRGKGLLWRRGHSRRSFRVCSGCACRYGAFPPPRGLKMPRERLPKRMGRSPPLLPRLAPLPMGVSALTRAFSLVGKRLKLCLPLSAMHLGRRLLKTNNLLAMKGAPQAPNRKRPPCKSPLPNLKAHKSLTGSTPSIPLSIRPMPSTLRLPQASRVQMPNCGRGTDRPRKHGM